MFEKNQDILLHPKGATTMPTGIKVLVCDDDAAFCKKMADLVRKSQPVDGCSAAVTTCCDPVALTDKHWDSSILRFWISIWAHTAGWSWRTISAV